MLLNSFWACDATWWHISVSTLVEVMACYLNHCWLVINSDLWYSPQSNFTTAHKLNLHLVSIDWIYKITTTSPRGQWVCGVWQCKGLEHMHSTGKICLTYSVLKTESTLGQQNYIKIYCNTWTAIRSSTDKKSLAPLLHKLVLVMARSSAHMVLNMQNKEILDFHEQWFQLLAPSQC